MYKTRSRDKSILANHNRLIVALEKKSTDTVNRISLKTEFDANLEKSMIIFDPSQLSGRHFF